MTAEDSYPFCHAIRILSLCVLKLATIVTVMYLVFYLSGTVLKAFLYPVILAEALSVAWSLSCRVMNNCCVVAWVFLTGCS